MTEPSQHDIDEGRRILQREAQPMMDKLLNNMRDRKLKLNPARWVAFLEFIDRDMAKSMLHRINESEPQRDDYTSQSDYSREHGMWEKAKRDMYTQFESFTEGRVMFHLDDPKAGAAFMSIMTAYTEVAEKARRFFEVESAA